MCEVCVRLCLGKSKVSLKGFIALYIFHYIRKYIQVSVESYLSQTVGKMALLQQERMERSSHNDHKVHPNQDRMKGNVNKC